ncbi:MAG: hypothetical protein HC792_02095, partial [Acaryochloridaceae cyanobacterium CSU_5_19]|nr:hypothetical protein [Acaryochloridaceae cyanobacterium CSU_5_19]
GGNNIIITPQPPDAALERLQEGQTDLVALSRLLTAEEKEQGFIQIPVTREKIAIVVGGDNGFARSLTIEQVVQIFQGKITDWSEIGGTPGPIRVIHRPVASNLQGTLQTYDFFNQAPLEAGGKILELDKDDVDTLAQELGTDGISYALFSQVLNTGRLRSVAMYNTLPDNPSYPFSQPFSYVYHGTPNASVQQFLEFVTSEPGQVAIATSKSQPTLTSDTDPNSADPNNSSGSSSSSSPSTDNSGSQSNQPSAQDSSTTPNSNTGSSEKPSARQIDWLPLGLIALSFGALVVGGLLKRNASKRKQTVAPRPAPNYAERVRPTTLQPTTTTLQSPSDPVGMAAAAELALADTNSTTSPEAISTDTVLQGSTSGPNTVMQTPTTQDQDPSSPRAFQTQLQNVTRTQLQPDIAEGSSINPTQPQDPTQTVLQEPAPTGFEEEDQTQLQDPTTNRLTRAKPRLV